LLNSFEKDKNPVFEKGKNMSGFAREGHGRKGCSVAIRNPARPQNFTLWQQAAIEATRRDHSIMACSHHIYVVLFFAHIRFVVNRAFRATPDERLNSSTIFGVLQKQHSPIFCSDRVHDTNIELIEHQDTIIATVTFLDTIKARTYSF